MVYADDFVVCFQNKEEAEEFYKHLKSRMEHFGMTLEESKTSRKKFTKTCKEVHRLIRDMRTKPLKAIIKKLNEMLVGYYHYYGITDNIQSLSDFRYQMTKSLFKWLNQRSQKKSYDCKGFNDMLKAYPLATPRIYVNVYVR